MTQKVMSKNGAPQTDALFKEPVEFLDSLIEFSAFGRVNINFLRGDKAFKFSPDIFTPPSLGDIKEFGYGLGPIALKRSFYKMVEDLTVASLKILVLHEAFVFRTSSFMVRIVRPWNRYPRYFWREEFYLWNGYEKAEVVFFCQSKKAEQRIRYQLDKFLTGKSFLYFIEEMFYSNFKYFSEKLNTDDDLVYIAALACYMTERLLENNKVRPFNAAIKHRKED